MAGKWQEVTKLNRHMRVVKKIAQKLGSELGEATGDCKY